MRHEKLFRKIYEYYIDSFYDDGDLVIDIAERKIVKAKKEHDCVCGEKIQKGDLYFNERALFDGEWHNCKTCKTCMNKLIKGTFGE